VIRERAEKRKPFCILGKKALAAAIPRQQARPA